MKALIFDMDGLMIDSERLYFQSERDIAADLYRAAEHIKALLGHSGQGRRPLRVTIRSQPIVQSN